MKKSGLVPDRVCYNTLLSAFMNSGKDDEVNILKFEKGVCTSIISNSIILQYFKIRFQFIFVELFGII